MPQTGLTKTEIIQAAYENVGRGSELATIGDRMLNTILNLLYEGYTWKVLESLATITFTAGSQTFTIPSDYSSFKTFVLVRSDLNASNPPNTPIHWLEMENFQLIPNPLTPGPPTHFSLLRKFSNLGNPGVTGYVFPVPNVSYTGRLLYLYKPSFDIADNITPEFSDQHTLIDLLTNEFLGLGYTANITTKTYDPQLLEKTIQRYRNMEVDGGIYSHRAQLDKRFFSPQRYATRGSWLNVNR
jgi:hypothetical protein